MGVFARWVVGFGVFAVVFAFFGFGASVGWWGALCLTAPPWRSLGAHMPRVGALAWAVVLRAGLVGNVGAGHDCPAPCSVACGARLLRGVGREAWRVGCSQGANTSARTRRETGPRGADRGGLAGGGGGTGVLTTWCIQSPLLAAGGGACPIVVWGVLGDSAPQWRAVSTRGGAKLTLLGRGR